MSKFGSKVKIDGPNRQGSLGKGKTITPGKQAIETPAKTGNGGKIGKVTPKKIKIEGPYNGGRDSMKGYDS